MECWAMIVDWIVEVVDYDALWISFESTAIIDEWNAVRPWHHSHNHSNTHTKTAILIIVIRHARSILFKIKSKPICLSVGGREREL